MRWGIQRFRKPGHSRVEVYSKLSAKYFTPSKSPRWYSWMLSFDDVHKRLEFRSKDSGTVTNVIESKAHEGANLDTVSSKPRFRRSSVHSVHWIKNKNAVFSPAKIDFLNHFNYSIRTYLGKLPTLSWCKLIFCSFLEHLNAMASANFINKWLVRTTYNS